MTRDEELRLAEDLREAWDALVAGQPLPADTLDPSLGATINHLYEVYQPPAPDPAFLESLGRALMPAVSTRVVHPPLGASPNGHVPHELWVPPQPTRGSHPPRLSTAMAVLATAALVTFALVAGFVAMLSSRQHPAEQRGVPLPAVAIPETTVVPSAAIETLFTATLPAGQVPESGVLQFFVWRLSLDPQSSTPATPEGSCCHGPQFTHVLSGELTVHVDGPMQIFRGSAQILADAGSPGSDVVLLPGDTVIHDFAHPATYANSGTTPAEIVNAGLYAGTALPFSSATLHFRDGSQEFHQAPFPPGPVIISLVQATLPPNGEFPAPPPGSLDLEVGQDGDASVGKNSDGSFVNIVEQDQTIYAVVVEPDGKPNLAP